MAWAVAATATVAAAAASPAPRPARHTMGRAEVVGETSAGVVVVMLMGRLLLRTWGRRLRPSPPTRTPPARIDTPTHKSPARSSAGWRPHPPPDPPVRWRQRAVRRTSRRADLAKLEAEIEEARPYLALAREINAEVQRVGAEGAGGDTLVDAIEAIPVRARAGIVRAVFDQLAPERQWAVLER